MNKKLFFFALICILTSTLLVSCRNLTQSAVQEFSFSIDAATAAKIAEKAPASHARASSIPDTDTRSVSIALKLTSVTPGVFLCTDSTTTTMNRLVGTTLTIDNVPLNVQLKASLECFVDGVKVYTAESDSSFTLVDETPYALSLTLREVKPTAPEYSTPYVVWKYIETIDPEGEPFIGKQYYRMANANAEPVAVFPEWNLPYPDMSLQYCFDSDGNLWLLAESTLIVLPAGESSVNKLIYTPMSQNFPIMTTLAYDASTDKLILIGYTEEDREPDFTLLSTDPDKLLKDAVDMPEDYTEIQTESFTASFTDYLENILFPLWDEAPVVEEVDCFEYSSKVYAYNGTLYCIEDYGDSFYLSWYCIETGYYDYKGLPYASGTDFAFPEDYSLDWVYATDEMADKDCNDYLLKAYDGWDFTDLNVSDVVTHEYNDIAVIDDTVYVLFHERVWSYYRDNWGDRSDDEGKFSEWLIDRGAILKFDADTLEYKGAIGLNEVKESVSVPANILVTDDSHYTKAYLDERLSRPATLNMKMVWGLPCEETAGTDRVFSNPMSFVAVGPKKLVVADGGVFYYTDTDYLPPNQKHEDTPCFQIATRAKSRIVTVDLDNYIRSDFGTFTNDYFQTEQPTGSSYMSIHDRTLQEGEKFYGKGFTAHFDDSYFKFDDFTNTTISYYKGLSFTGYNEDNEQKTTDSLNIYLTGTVTFGEQE